MQIIEERKKLEILLDNSLLKIVKKIGGIEQFMIEAEAKAERYSYVQNMILHVFTTINDFIEEYKDSAEELLDGEFNTILWPETPLFLILDFLYSLSFNHYVVLSENEKKQCETLIEYARNLKCKDCFNKKWHVNEKIVQEIKTNDATCDLHCFSSTVSFPTKIERGNFVLDRYISTIGAYKTFFPERTNRVEDYYFNFDFHSYPELVSNEIWYCRVTNRTYNQWNERGVSESNSSIVLFQEQEEKIIKDYQKLCESKHAMDMKRKKQEAIDVVLPYLQDKSFREFIVIPNISWKNECLKDILYYLEQIYFQLEQFRKCDKKELTFLEALNDERFIKEIISDVYSIESLSHTLKKIISEQIANYYAVREKKKVSRVRGNCWNEREKIINKKYSLIKKLQELPLDELLGYYSKLESNFLAHISLNKSLKNLL